MPHFEQPLLLFGMLGALIPIVVHLFGRRRAPVRRFAALEFLISSNRQLARSLKMKQWLVLLVRALLAACLAVALAKPFFVERLPEQAALAGGRPTSLVIVFDDSLSMTWRRGMGAVPDPGVIAPRAHSKGADTPSLLDRARERAVDLVNDLPDGSSVAIVLASAPARALMPELSFERRDVLGAVAGLIETGRGNDLAGALRIAEGLLASSSLARRQIVVLTDLARHAWEPVRSPWALPEPPNVVVEDVSRAEEDNVAITSVSVAPAPDVGPEQARVDVGLRNQGPQPWSGTLTVEVGSRVVKGSVELRPNGSDRRSFTIKLEGGATDVGRAWIPSDRLPGDNARSFVASFAEHVPVLIVDGAPRNVPILDEVFFLGRALRPGDDFASRIRATVVKPDDLSPQLLAEARVVVLANPPRLPEATVAALRAAVEGGVGLLVTAGDNIPESPAGWPGAGLLPLPVREVKRMGDPRDGVPPLGFAPPDRTHPVFSGQRTEADLGLQAARVSSFALLEAARPGDETRVLVSYTNGAPALVETKVGSGRVALLTTSIDRDWTDLPVRPAYLPLLQTLVGWLAGRADVDAPIETPPGKTRLLRVPKGALSASVVRPDGSERRFEDLTPFQAGGLPFEETDLVGVYALRFFGTRGAAPIDTTLFAVNPDATESDLSRIASEAAVARLGANRTSDVESPAGTKAELLEAGYHRTEAWPSVLVALFLLLLGEAWLLVRT